MVKHTEAGGEFSKSPRLSGKVKYGIRWLVVLFCLACWIAALFLFIR